MAFLSLWPNMFLLCGEENLKPAVIFNVASNSAIKWHGGVSPYSRPPPPTSSCSLQAKPRWVHVKDHMTIGIPDPARACEWIRPNSTMSQATKGTAPETEWQAFSAWTHTGRTAFLWKCHVVRALLANILPFKKSLIKPALEEDRIFYLHQD